MGRIPTSANTHQPTTTTTTTAGNMNKTARELVSGQQVEWVRPDDLVDQALQKMAKNDLTALPVVEPSTGTAPGAIKGFVDVVDLVAFLANVGTRTMTNPYGAGESRSIATDDMAILHRRSKEFRITNTVEISDYCKRNPLHKVNQNMNAKDLIGKKRAEGLVYCEREKSLVEVMNRINQTRVHRLYVV